jgi:hypothetical protein
MAVTCSGNTLSLGATAAEFEWPILQFVELDGMVLVLLDPDAYLADISSRRAAAKPIRNLIAVDRSGHKLWSAELPEHNDYYYKIVSGSPLWVNAFSSHRCRIDPTTGKILESEFFK